MCPPPRFPVYRAAYGQSRAELMAGEQDGGKVAVGVLVGIGASYLLFAGLQSLGKHALMGCAQVVLEGRGYGAGKKVHTAEAGMEV